MQISVDVIAVALKSATANCTEYVKNFAVRHFLMYEISGVRNVLLSGKFSVRNFRSIRNHGVLFPTFEGAMLCLFNALD